MSLYIEEVIEKRRNENKEEMLITLELVEEQRAQEVDILNEINGSYARSSFDSLHHEDYTPGYDY